MESERSEGDRERRQERMHRAGRSNEPREIYLCRRVYIYVADDRDEREREKGRERGRARQRRASSSNEKSGVS